MIDRTALLATLKPLVSDLEDSIRARAVETPDVAEHLEREHHRAVVAERTAMSLEEWRDGEITQAAVAWVLGCVFVRFLEDNGLVDQALISGPGERRAAALGHREEHFRAHPAHSDREYLEACFREVANYPAVAPLYDERHNPLWRLGPAADGARSLRETFTVVTPATGELTHDFTDQDLDTRFLGDLYQDLSEAAKKRYALLQTPVFVERFILDRTLDPAIEEFGVDEVRLIDPTCGSGHFLIGAFGRLFPEWQKREPATTATVLAQRCLDQIAGVDLNPFATAIARFRLVIAALRACGITRLAAAPALRLHLATGDSLLHGPLPQDGATMLFDANRLNQNVAHVYESEDAADLKEILGRGYHTVVGNPPYIVGDDEAVRSAYRDRYESCHREFALSVPFMERFFELARVKLRAGQVARGHVGQITANSFMRREFGALLVERFLPSVDVTTIIDTSRAHIPGHATPTVILFGRGRPPVSERVRLVEGLRGQAKRPVDPSLGAVWRDLVALTDRPGETTDYVRSSDISRADLASHPMSLGPGRLLKKRLEDSTPRRVTELATDMGYSGQTNIDDVFLRPSRAWKRANVTPEALATFVTGVDVRDWSIAGGIDAWFPYSESALRQEVDLGGALKALWAWRETAWARRTFQKTSYKEEGRTFYEWHQIALDRHRTPYALVWAYKYTGVSFAFSRGGRVFNKHAPFVKLRDESEDSYLRLAAALNSSVACFWLKQVCQDTGVGGIGGGIGDEAWEPRYEFGAGRVAQLPLPAKLSASLARSLDASARLRAGLLDSLPELQQEHGLREFLADAKNQDEALTARLISLQEELDWQLLAAYDLAPNDLPVLGDGAPPIKLGERAFEIVLARQIAAGETETTWFARHDSTPITSIPDEWPAEYRDVVQRRIALVDSDADIGLIERPEHKRRWNRPAWDDRQHNALTGFILDALEERELWADLRLRSTNELTDELRRRPLLLEALELISDRKDADLATTLRRLVLDAAVPHLVAQRLTDKGLRKREVWERVWELQRAEDTGEAVDAIPVPTKYAQSDFRSALYWKHRGKFDVPKERFVLIPNAERGADTSPVVGWAGWNERDLARVLAGRITELRQEHAADSERLVPLLAGVLELLPGMRQWHPEADAFFGGPPAAFFESWLDGELASLGVTRGTLRAWRPPASTRVQKAKASTT